MSEYLVVLGQRNLRDIQEPLAHLRPTICSSKLLGMNVSCLSIQKVAFDPSGDQLPNKGTDTFAPCFHFKNTSESQIDFYAITEMYMVP